MSKKKFLIIWGLFFLISLLIRLPYFLNDGLLIDEDEAIIGIMAKDFLNGEGLSYYFYGQEYGLSFIEVITASLFIVIIGVSAWSLKLGALFLFSLGATFLYTSFKEKESNKWFLIALSLLILTFPTWYVWGGLLRGGYITAFTACSAIFYLTQKKESTIWMVLLAACLVFIAYDSHALILFPIIPILGFWIIGHSKWLMRTLIFTASTILLITGVKAIVSAINGRPPVSVSLSGMSWENFILHIENWQNGFSGYYFFTVQFDIPLYWKTGIYFMMIVFILFIVLGLINGVGRQKLTILVTVAVLVFNLVLLSAIDETATRYFIGFYSGLLFLTLYILRNISFKRKNQGLYCLTIFSIIGLTASITIPRHWYNNGHGVYGELQTLHETVKKEDVKAVMMLDNKFAWNFLFGEEIPATNFCWTGRTNSYAIKAMEIYKTAPEKVYMCGFHGLYYGTDLQEDFANNTKRLGQNYFIKRSISDEDMRLLRTVYPCYYDDYW